MTNMGNRLQLFTLFLGLTLLIIALCCKPYVCDGRMISSVAYYFFQNSRPNELKNGDTIIFDSEQYAFQIGLAAWCPAISLFQMRCMKNSDKSLTANLDTNSIPNIRKNLRRMNIRSLTWIGLLGIFVFEIIAWNASIAFMKLDRLLEGVIACFVILFLQLVAFRFISQSKL